MANTEREELKVQLRAMATGRDNGIDLDTPFHWEVDGLNKPDPFFEHLPELLPPDSILYVEGTSIAPDIAAFYSSHHARNAVEVVRDTIMPSPDTYHLAFSPEVVVGLRQTAAGRPI